MSDASPLPTVRHLLLVLLAASMVPMLLIAVGVMGYQYWRERAATDASSIATARALMATVDDRLDDLGQALDGLARSRHFAEGDLPGFRREAATVQRAERALGLVLLDAQGLRLMDTQLPDGQALAQQPEPAMLVALRKGAPAALDLFEPPGGGGLRMGVGVPVRMPGGAAFALNAYLAPAALQQVLQRQKLPPGWIASVLDSQGRIVARTHEPERFLGTPARAALIQRIAEAGEDAVESVTVDGVPVATAFSRSDRSGWSVAIGMPRAQLRAPAETLLGLLLGGAVLVLGLSVWLALRQAGRISGSVEALGAAVRAVVHGRPLRLPPSRFREAQQLADAFRHACAAAQDAGDAAARDEQRLHAILQSARDAIVTADADGRILQINAAAEALFGIDAEDALGQPVDIFVPPASREAHRAGLARFAALGESPRMLVASRMVHAMRSDGSTFPVEASISSVQCGEERLLTAILRDVTEREQHKEALERSNLELRQFAYVASHDLSAPLKSIGGYLALVRARHGQALGEAGLQLVERARQAALRLEQLTAELLAYARLESGARAMAPVDCGAIVAEVLQLLDEDVRAAGAVVRVEPLPTVTGDAGQLTQLFLNLVGNALKYRCAAPQIRIAAQRQDGGWLFAVHDNGIGIEAPYLHSIFEIFKRLHTQREYPGTGIGLALCRRIVERHGGRIWAESVPGEGSVFRFTLADIPGDTP